MKKLNIVLSLLFCWMATSGFAQSNELNIPLSKAGEKGMLNVEIHDGPVTVKGTARQDVLLRYEMTAEENKKKEKGTNANGLKRISGGGISLEILEKDNKVSIEAEHTQKTTTLYIEVPKNFDLDINTHHNGDVVISDVNGEIVIESHHGGIKAENISGSVVANTWHGGIEVSFKRLSPDTPLAFSTYHGKIDISLPANTRANLKMRSDMGEIYTGFDVDLKKQTNTQKKEENGLFKISMNSWVTGALNGGGPEIMAKNYHGNIYIRELK